MGKKGGSSWLTAVKRAFRSPSKDSDKKPHKKAQDNKQDHDLEDEEDKKREKRRWLFRKPTTVQENVTVQGAQSTKVSSLGVSTEAPVSEQRHAAAAAAAKAAVEVARLSRPTAGNSRDRYAATIIQTAFRGYLRHS